METAGTGNEPKATWWREIFTRWEESGLSQREFCKQDGVSLSGFRYWRHRLTRRDEESSGAFVRVGRPRKAVAEGSKVRIETNGVVVETDADIDPARLKAILTVVRDAS